MFKKIMTYLLGYSFFEYWCRARHSFYLFSNFSYNTYIILTRDVLLGILSSWAGYVTPASGHIIFFLLGRGAWIFDRSLQAMWRYSQCRHRSCNDRQSLAIAMYRTVEYENKKQYFCNSEAILCPSLKIRWRHWEYRHMACGAMS